MSPRLYLDLDMHVWQLDGQTGDGAPCVPGGPTIDQIAERFGPLVEITGEYEPH